MKYLYKKNHNQGFTLLFAVLVSTLVVSIGATIISIALRQTILSGTTRESQYAFYAANTVLECAHYWDTTVRQDMHDKVVFPILSTDVPLGPTDTEAVNVTCAGVNIITGEGNEVPGVNNGLPREMEFDDTNGDAWTFYLKIEDKAGISGLLDYEYCAQATVSKSDDSSNITTTIEAKGYNTCVETNPRRVERGLVEQYQS